MKSALFLTTRFLILGVFVSTLFLACKKDKDFPILINIPGKLLFGKYAYQTPGSWGSGDIFYELTILRNIGTQPLQIYYNHEARWSPDGLSIAYSVSQNDGIASRVFLLEPADNYAAPQLLFADTFNRWTALSWAPDARKLALGSFFLNDLHVFDFDTKTIQKVETGLKVNDVDWSPDGNTILLTGINSENRQDIYTLHLTENELINLTKGNAPNCAKPRWSPDGKKIAFSSNDQIMWMDADGKNRVTLGSGSSPDWSFDAQHLAFARYQDGLFIMKTDGTNTEQLYKGKVGQLDLTTH